MNISLTPQLESYVRQKVADGMYGSASEVIREALRLLEERDALKDIKMEALRRDIQLGNDELDKGEGKPLDMAGIKAKARAIKQNTG